MCVVCVVCVVCVWKRPGLCTRCLPACCFSKVTMAAICAFSLASLMDLVFASSFCAGVGCGWGCGWGWGNVSEVTTQHNHNDFLVFYLVVFGQFHSERRPFPPLSWPTHVFVLLPMFSFCFLAWPIHVFVCPAWFVLRPHATPKSPLPLWPALGPPIAVPDGVVALIETLAHELETPVQIPFLWA